MLPKRFDWVRIICEGYARGKFDEDRLCEELALYEATAGRYKLTPIPEKFQQDIVPTTAEKWQRIILRAGRSKILRDPYAG